MINTEKYVSQNEYQPQKTHIDNDYTHPNKNTNINNNTNPNPNNQ